ncbi:hypothetical protein ABTX81_33480 [Kitasatospora sp. NPDC097605]|uniref:hypothetical protein n=1 Tax=Kitasatospora sp. NPDC097605 TaxID=3157226 RepID=UPI00331E7826
MGENLKKPGILAALALALVATFGPVATAQAAPAPNGSAGAGAAAIADVTTRAVTGGTPSAAGDGCTTPLPLGAPTVIRLCGTVVHGWQWPDGRNEWVAVGSDRQVWHTFQSSAGGSWSSWAVFGSASGVLDGVVGSVTNGIPLVGVLGSDGYAWCNTIGANGMWTDWQHC